MTLVPPGSMSLKALAAVTLASALVAGALAVVSSAFAASRIASERADFELEVAAAIEGVKLALASNGSPSADSRFDLAAMPFPPGVTIEDVSSRLNPNHLGTAFLDSLKYVGIMQSGANGYAIRQERFDKGLAIDLPAVYGDYFTEAAFERHLTPYSYANVNVAEEFALERLYSQARGTESGYAAFRAKVGEVWTTSGLLEPERFLEFFGSTADGVFPTICAEPQINVNFADPLVLEAVLKFPGFAVKNPPLVLKRLLDEAAAAEIDAPRLAEILGKAESNLIYAYLGVHTWFWRVRLSRRGRSADIILARVPRYSEESGSPYEFRVVSVGYE